MRKPAIWLIPMQCNVMHNPVHSPTHAHSLLEYNQGHTGQYCVQIAIERTVRHPTPSTCHRELRRNERRIRGMPIAIANLAELFAFIPFRRSISGIRKQQCRSSARRNAQSACLSQGKPSRAERGTQAVQRAVRSSLLDSLQSEPGHARVDRVG